MAEPKTRPTDQDPVAFVTERIPKYATDSLQLIETLKAITNEEPVMWGPSIVGFGHYTVLDNRKKPVDWPIIGFSPRSTALTVYIMPGFTEKTETLKALGPHKLGACCLYIKRLSDVDYNVLTELMIWSVKTMRAKYSMP